ncbi:type II secretion system protein E [Halodesulfurarchaeum formicicum]|uniref:Type II secretion system protein E n=1 Tax=Halodesulfurarchaeum formicicum TaxID=1873524 RepID=A0A1D8S3Q5_9EURY|nr:type II/IV secretion system ATPase subunit [Halodesulfurarchaeum formicicum]AOW79987.1 type II secretion system protein E [Halodesulfurarchaeum formicicum]
MSRNTAQSESAVESIRYRLSQIAAVLRGSALDVDPYDPARDGPLVQFAGLEDFEEVDRYWVNAPFAFVVIAHNAAENAYRYLVVEPTLSEFEHELLEQVFTDSRESLIFRAEYDPKDAEAVITEHLLELLGQYGVEVDTTTIYRLFYYLYRSFEGFDKLDPLMKDPHIEDISCDGYDLPLFVYHDTYTDIQTNRSFGEAELDDFVVRLAQNSGQHISIGDPITNATLADGSRGELALGREVTPRGSAFTIRKYAEEPFTPATLIEYDTFSLDQMAYLWLAIESNKSLIFAGGTASGKTTSMNAVSMFVPPNAKVVTIEDTRELTLHHDNWLSSVTRESLGEGEDISMYDLLRSSLRHRPEYIVVGEVRGREAMTLFQAMNTGHTTFSTMHADSVQTVINRLENEPINVPRAMIQSLDVLSVQTLTYVGEQRVRRTNTIAEIEGIDQRTGDLDYSMAFEYDPETDSFNQFDSVVLEEIRQDRGWSRSELLREFRDRKRVLQYLLEQDVRDYRRFTAVINDYYADRDTVMGRIEAQLETSVGDTNLAEGHTTDSTQG